MGENINEKLKKILSQVSSDKLKNSADIASKFLSTKEGQKFKNSLSDSDKKAILEKFMQLDPQKAEDAIKNADISGIDAGNIEEVLKKLK